MQSESSEERCRFIKENGEPCRNMLTGVERSYCTIHREAGRKQYKARINGQYVEAYREDKHNEYLIQNAYHQFLHRHRLTQPNLTAFFDRAEAQQEYDPCLKYEGYEYALKEFHETEGLILNPHAGLPSVAKIANKQAKQLLKSLEDQKKDSPKDSTTDRLILSTMGLQRDIGQRMSTKTFTNIGRKAKAVHELGKKLGEPLVLVYGLLVDGEMARILYFAHYASPKKRQFYANKALNTLSGAEVFCDMLIKRSTGKRKQVAEFLRFYVDSARLRQASDAGEGDHSASHIEAADERATDFAAAYGEVPIVANVQFLNLTNQAEYHLGCGDFDLASQRLTDAKEKFAAMPWNPIEALHRIASLEKQLALVRNDPERERYVHEYLSVLERNPCYEYRHCLRALKDRFRSDVPDVKLLTLDDKYLFVDTMHTLIQPFVTLI